MKTTLCIVHAPFPVLLVTTDFTAHPLCACQEPPPPPRKTRAELMKDIDADYYGYRDEDDGILVPLEREMEKKVSVFHLQDSWKH